MRRALEATDKLEDDSSECPTFLAPQKGSGDGRHRVILLLKRHQKAGRAVAGRKAQRANLSFFGHALDDSEGETTHGVLVFLNPAPRAQTSTCSNDPYTIGQNHHQNKHNRLFENYKRVQSPVHQRSQSYRTSIKQNDVASGPKQGYRSRSRPLYVGKERAQTLWVARQDPLARFKHRASHCALQHPRAVSGSFHAILSCSLDPPCGS